MMNRFQLKKSTALYLVLISMVFATTAFSQETTFYKYTNAQGTVVITQSLQEIPPEKRETAETIQFSEITPKPPSDESDKILPENPLNQPLPLAEGFSEDQIKAAGEEAFIQGQRMLTRFFKDQHLLLGAYIVGGVIGFWMFSKLLKRLAGGFVTRIVMKLCMVVVLFSGIYLLYLSWLNKNVLNFNQAPSTVSNDGLIEQITTPSEILEKTEDVVEQFNQKTKEREALLNGMDNTLLAQ